MQRNVNNMRIISYNVNGIRAAIAKGLLEWLAYNKPDVVCFQEIKATQDQIPLLEIEALGYHDYWFPAQKKGYSGVAILSKIQPDNVVYGMNNKLYDDEGRFLRADFGNISIISVYHPSGTSGDERQDFKMQWLSFFRNYVNTLRKERPNLILSGDYNICHEAIDIHDPVRNAKSSGFSRKKDSGFPTSSTTAISIVSELYVKREDIIAGGALEATHVITTKAGELITTYLQIILEINLLMRQYIQMSNIRIIVL